MKFSIITPTYARPAELVRCIASVRAQTYRKYEHLICSDGHSASDEQCVKSYKDKKMKYSHVKREGRSYYGNKQRNKMIQEAKGEYLIFLDDDNSILPHYLKAAKDSIDNHGIMIFRIWHNTASIIPRENEIELGAIDSLNFVVRKDIAQKFAWNVMEYSADYSFIKSCEQYCIENGIKIGYSNNIIGRHY
jgi:glycosyltransferase involved in cell wall biosynthesis